jgi:hypothetical protein
MRRPCGGPREPIGASTYEKRRKNDAVAAELPAATAVWLLNCGPLDFAPSGVMN